ncbi:hypothetical protein Hdeb2414_s0323g00867471 [Helianthus debilis subsp. tardiflorus]
MLATLKSVTFVVDSDAMRRVKMVVVLNWKVVQRNSVVQCEDNVCVEAYKRKG